MHAPLTSDDTLTASERLRAFIAMQQEKCNRLPLTSAGGDSLAKTNMGYFIAGLRAALALIEEAA